MIADAAERKSTLASLCSEKINTQGEEEQVQAGRERAWSGRLLRKPPLALYLNYVLYQIFLSLGEEGGRR